MNVYFTNRILGICRIAFLADEYSCLLSKKGHASSRVSFLLCSVFC